MIDGESEMTDGENESEMIDEESEMTDGESEKKVTYGEEIDDKENEVLELNKQMNDGEEGIKNEKLIEELKE